MYIQTLKVAAMLTATSVNIESVSAKDCINQLPIHCIEYRPAVKAFFLAGLIQIDHLPNWGEYHTFLLVLRTDWHWYSYA